MDSTNNLKSAKRQSDSKKIIAKRFSDEQIKSLESIFKLETKLEPKKKLHIANDLGLQPRQVAIWFQNKRARWKSKQIEEEYKDLKANYDSLYLKFDDLQREKLFLQTQLRELNDIVKNLDQKVDLTNEDDEFKEYPNSSNIEEMDDHNVDVMKTDYDQQELVSWDEEAEIISHLASPEKWSDFSSGGLFGQSGASSWWES